MWRWGGDCDDTNAETHPNATEICDDGRDNDCSGDAPECRLEGGYLLSDSDITWTSGSDGFFGLDVRPLDIDGDGDLELAVLKLEPGGQGTTVLYESAQKTSMDEGDVVWSSGTFGDVEDLAQPLEAVDFNDDGADDLIIGSTDALELYAGRLGALPNNSAHTRVEPTTQGEGFGIYVFAVGLQAQQPNSGFGTFSFRDSSAGEDAGVAFIWYGEPSDAESSEDADLLIQGQPGDRLGDAGAFAQGDADGDGQLDYLFGASRQGRAYLWYAPASDAVLEAGDADLTLSASSSTSFFGGAVGLGDLNADGYDDLIIAEPRLSSETIADGGGASIFLGEVSRLDGEIHRDRAEVRITGSDSQMFAGGTIQTGDLNQDGIDDLVLGGWQVYGDAFGFYGPLATDTSVGDAEITIDGSNGGFCAYTIELADINGDGSLDLVIPCPGSGGGQVRAILGVGP